MSSDTELKGTLGWSTSTLGTTETSVTASGPSRGRSKLCVHAHRDRVVHGADEERIAVGCAFAASSAPIVRRRPAIVDDELLAGLQRKVRRQWARERIGPRGRKGTMSRTGLVGHDWALAVADTRMRARSTTSTISACLPSSDILVNRPDASPARRALAGRFGNGRAAQCAPYYEWPVGRIRRCGHRTGRRPYPGPWDGGRPRTTPGRVARCCGRSAARTSMCGAPASGNGTSTTTSVSPHPERELAEQRGRHPGITSSQSSSAMTRSSARPSSPCR